MKHCQRSMAVYQQASKLMFTTQSILPQGRNMQLKYTKHQYWCSRIEIVMLKGSSDLDVVIVRATHGRWWQCGHKNSYEI